MATSLATLGIKINAAQAIEGLKRLDHKLKGVGLSSSQVGTKLVKFGRLAGAAIGGLAVLSIKTAADFEQSMNKVAAIGGHTGETLQALEDQARELGRSTAFSAAQAADGMTFLAMAGFDAKESLAAMPGVLNLAAASSTDLATSADIASNILSGLGLGAGKTGKLVDVMAKATSSANLNVIELGEAMKMSAPMAKTAGLSLEGMTAVLGKMADAGIKGSLAGTSLRSGIVKLLKPTVDAQEALAGLNVNIANTDGTMRNFIDILADLEKGGADATDMVDIFGLRAGPALMASMSQGVDGIKGLKTELEGAGGTAKKMADIQLQGLNGALKKLNSAWQDLQITFAKTGILEKLTDKVLELTDSFGKKETIEQIKEFGRGILTIGSGIKSVFEAYMNLPKYVREVGIVMAFLGGKKAKLVIAGITALSWGIGKIGDAMSGVSEKAKDMPDIFGEGSNEVRAMRAEIDKFAKQAQVLRDTGMFQGVKLDAEAIQPTLNHISTQMARIAKQAEDLMASFKDPIALPDIIKPAETDSAPVTAKVLPPSFFDEMKLGYKETLDNMKTESESAAASIGSAFAGVFGRGGTLSTGMGAAMSDILVYGKKSGEVFQKLGQTIMGSIVNALVAAGVQMAVNWAKKKAMAVWEKITAVTTESVKSSAYIAGQTTRTSTSVAAAATEAAAWTPAAMMSSIASFGSSAVMAIAGILAVSALMKSFEGGGFTGSGSRTGGVDGKGGFPALLHPNETVVDHTRGQGAGGSGTVVNNSATVELTINTMDSQSFQQSMVENSELIVGVIRNAFTEQGQATVI